MIFVVIGKKEGAKVLVGGVQLKEGDLAKGSFIAPTLLTDVTNDMRIAQEEIFGPVAVIMKFKTADEVIALANDSEYGLGNHPLANPAGENAPGRYAGRGAAWSDYQEG